MIRSKLSKLSFLEITLALLNLAVFSLSLYLWLKPRDYERDFAMTTQLLAVVAIDIILFIFYKIKQARDKRSNPKQEITEKQ